MKRILYIALIAAAFISSACDKLSPEENSHGNKSYIFFDAGVIDIEETKAVVDGDKLPNDKGTAFAVVGKCGSKTLFGGYSNKAAKVYRNSEGVFVYNQLEEWVDENTKHTFYAFYPWQLNANKADDNVWYTGNKTYISYKQPANVGDMIDVMIDSQDISKCQEVIINFKHSLWALDINVKNSQESEKLEVRDVKFYISGIKESGKINFDGSEDNESVKTENVHTYIYTYVNSTSGNGIVLQEDKKTLECEPLLFLPVENIEYKIEITFKNSRGFEYTYTYPAQGFQTKNQKFAAGHRYSLTIEKIDPENFNVSWLKNGWIQEDLTHTFE